MRSGFVFVDKPDGVTSFDVVRRVRRAVNNKKCGHAGTLDPGATGLLIVAVGHATRLLRFLDLEPKRYEFDIVLGTQTNTDDHEGETIAELPVLVESIDDVLGALLTFVGEVDQVPPKFSAIHIDGQRAYKRARDGEDFEMPSRRVNVFSVGCDRFEDNVASCWAEVGGGTYIRAIARDVGEALGTVAHARAIRRTSLGACDVNDGVRLDDLGDELRPMIDVLSNSLPMAALSEEEMIEARMGKVVPHSDAVTAAVGTFVGLVGVDVIGVAEVTDAGLQPRVIFPE